MEIFSKPIYSLNSDLLTLIDALSIVQREQDDPELLHRHNALGFVDFAHRLNLSQEQLNRFSLFEEGPLRTEHYPAELGLLKSSSPKELIAGLRSMQDEHILNLLSSAVMNSLEPQLLSHESIIDKLAADKQKLLARVKELQIGDDRKWRIFEAVQEPSSWFGEYIDLLESILPPFLTWRATHEEGLNREADRLEHLIQQGGLASLDDYTQGLVEGEVISSYLTGDLWLVVSAIPPGRITLNARRDSILTVSYGIQEFLQAMADMRRKREDMRVLLCKNLGDKTRYEVLKAIAKGEVANKDLARRLGISSATVSYHVNQLVVAGILKVDAAKGRFGYTVHHELVNSLLTEWIEWFSEGIKEHNQA